MHEVVWNLGFSKYNQGQNLENCEQLHKIK